jgi:hypothetical protein
MKPHIYYQYGAWWCNVRPLSADTPFMGMSCVDGPVAAYNDWKAQQSETDQP